MTVTIPVAYNNLRLLHTKYGKNTYANGMLTNRWLWCHWGVTEMHSPLKTFPKYIYGFFFTRRHVWEKKHLACTKRTLWNPSLPQQVHKHRCFLFKPLRIKNTSWLEAWFSVVKWGKPLNCAVNIARGSINTDWVNIYHCLLLYQLLYFLFAN